MQAVKALTDLFHWYAKTGFKVVTLYIWVAKSLILTLRKFVTVKDFQNELHPLLEPLWNIVKFIS